MSSNIFTLFTLQILRDHISHIFVKIVVHFHQNLQQF